MARGNSNQEWQLILVTIGATTPFISYEAESGTLGGGATVVSLTSTSTTEFSSPQREASGHAFVNLGNTGQSVTWTNNTGKNITFVNVRYSIPDSSSGGGITSTSNLYVNGSFRQAINVNSIQTWVYESSGSYAGEASYWGQEKDLYVGSDNVTLAFIDYFDFSNVSLRDFQYYRCKVLRFSSHPEYESREASIQALDGRVFHDEEHDDTPSS